MKPTQLINLAHRAWIVVFVFISITRLQGSPPTEQTPSIKFVENKGQWQENVLFKLRFNTGVLFLEKDRLTFSFIDENDLDGIYHAHHSQASETATVKGHTHTIHLDNANPAVTVEGLGKYQEYENYFLGKDPGKWRSQVPAFSAMRYNEIYDGIDLTLSGEDGHLKYTYQVQPNADPAQISHTLEGVDEIYLRDGKLYYKTSINTIYEEKPYSYQIINNVKEEVESRFVLDGDHIGFVFPNGYNPVYPLVIDPVIVFSTYTGSFANNFGFTATYDNTGHLYAGGIVFGMGYPVTIGAFDTTYNSGAIDVSITKFTPDGTGLVYSTFLGGSESENPSSIVVNDQDELIVLGTTSSSDFPTTAGAYDNSFNGGVGKNYPNNGPNFVSGTDIFLSKFDASGSQLSASTFIGGSGNDGLNDNDIPGSYGTLVYNYGDQFRGEVLTDAQGNIYAVSSTLSSDFPTTAGAFQTTAGGGQDAVLFKFDTNLSSLFWSSYLGGTGTDAGYNLITDAQSNVYVSGGTESTNFPATAGALNSSYQGGRSDGYIAKISANGSTILNATYLGTTGYDQSYFIDQDASRNVYVVGQTDGAYPVTSGVYTNPNSGQYLTSLTSDLSTIVFSTVFGRGDGDPDISPTAFLVDKCSNIYVSGWGGNNLMSIVNPGAFNSTVIGLPITADAYQSTPDATGSDFYFGVFGANAASLTYGTYFGSPSANDHVDGGTSRFDKNGIIYQAVCAGCQNFDDFPTTPGAWSNTNNSFGCNEGLVKFEFQLIGVDVDIEANPDTTGCPPFDVDFHATGVNAQEYFWDLGDGSISHDSVFTHTYDDPGTYFVTLIGIDSTTCAGSVFSDTATTNIVVFQDFTTADAGPDQSVCPGESVLLTASGGTAYEWSTNEMTQSITVSPQTTTEYRVTVTNSNGCTDSDTVLVRLDSTYLTNVSTEICEGDSLFVGGGFQTSSGTYFDTLTTANGCDSIIQTELTVLLTQFTLLQDTVCTGDTSLLGTQPTFRCSQDSNGVIDPNSCALLINSTYPLIDTIGNFTYYNGQSDTYDNILTFDNSCRSITNVRMEVTFFDLDGFEINADIFLRNLYMGNIQVADANVSNLPVIPPNFIEQDSADGGFYSSWEFNSNFWNGTDPSNINWFVYFVNYGFDSDFMYSYKILIYYKECVETNSNSVLRTDTLVGSSGCDSIIVTETTYLPIPTSNVQATICDGDSYFAGGEFQTTPGTYIDTFTAANGCDSILTTELAVLPSPTTIIDTGICDGSSYLAGGAAQTTAGTYFDTLSTFDGCDSIIVTNLSILPIPMETMDISICDGESYFVGGDFQTTSGTYFDTLSASNGCDSIVTTNLTVLPVSNTTVDVAICDGESYFAGGALQTTSGTYFDTLASANGCDSVVTTNLTVSQLDVTFDVTNVSCACASSGNTGAPGECVLDFSGLPHGTILNNQFSNLGVTISGDAHGNGPNDLVVFNSNLSGTPDPDLEAGIGNLAIFPVNTTDSNGDGLVDNPDDNAAGGKMIFTFDTDRTIYSFVFVDNDRYSGSVRAYDAANNLIGALSTPSSGNGSVQTVQVNISGVRRLEIEYTDSRGVTQIRMSCPVQTCNLDFAGLPNGTFLNNQFAADGINISAEANGNGIDTVIVFNSNLTGTPDPDLEAGLGNLAIIPNDINDSNGDGLVDAPNDYAGGGKMIFTFDSDRTVYSFTLVDNDRQNGTATAYDASGQVITTVTTPSGANGSVQIVPVNAQGVRRLEIEYNDSRAITDLVLSCPETSCCDGAVTAIPIGGIPPYQYLWESGETTAILDSLCEGTHTVTVTDSIGCVTIDSVTIGQDDAFYTNENVEICEGESFFVGGAYQTMSGIYYDTTGSTLGCDSITMTELVVHPVWRDSFSVQICQGDSLLAGGDFQTTSGSYIDTLVSSQGCDSLLVVELTVLPAPVTIQSIEICEGDSAFIGGAWQTELGSYFDTLNNGGCDSIIQTNLTVNLNPQALFTFDTVCFGDSTHIVNLSSGADSGATFVIDVFNDGFVDLSGPASQIPSEGDQVFPEGTSEFKAIIINSTGCSDTFLTTVEVLPLPDLTLAFDTICQGENIFLGGDFQGSAGTYIDTFTSVNGCDSVVSTELTVLPPLTSNDTIEICEGDSALIAGIWQAIPGTYTDTFQAANGCDSISTVLLTAIPVDTTVQQVFICESDSFFAGGANQTISGVYFDVLTGIDGCDSIVRTELTVSPELILSATSTDVNCTGGNDGEIDLSVSGGILPYDFTWSNGATGEDVTGLAASSYSVTVTDSIGCPATLTEVISQPAPLALGTTTTPVSCFGGSDGAVDLIVLGGTAPYTFVWSNGEITEDISGLAAGNYTVMVTDSLGCQATLIVIVQEPQPIDLNASITNVSAPGGNDGAIDLSVNGGTSPYDYQWSSGDTTEDIDSLSAGDYFVTVIDFNGCQATDTLTVNDSTARQDQHNFSFRVYPVPFNHNLILEFFTREEADADVSIFDLLGRKVKHDEFVAKKGKNKRQIILSPSLSEGVYLFRFKLDNQVKGTKRIVK